MNNEQHSGSPIERGIGEERPLSFTKIMVFIALPVVSFIVSLFLGRLFINPIDVLKILGSKLFFIPFEHTWADTIETVVIRIRLPRAIMAMVVGSGLSISGAAFQGMFHNPLVSPYILGVSAGAGFGAALSIVMETSILMLQVFAFVGGIIAVAIAYYMSRIYRVTPILMLVLSGIVVSAFFQALISLLKYTADREDKLPAIVFWLMGSISHIHLEDLITVIPAIFIGAVGLLMIRWRINVLSMGEKEARAMGVNTELVKAMIILFTMGSLRQNTRST